MSTEKLAAVQKALRESAGLATWYREQHEMGTDDFTVQNVREYGCGGLGGFADQIIADAIGYGILPDEAAEL